jgi:acyl-CoA synthetase (AMP-forming)/AMP-acid ligase II
MPHHGPPLAPLVDLTRLLESGLGGDPAAPALQDLVHSLSWAELDRQVERLARAYRQLGLQRGDRLASLIPNRVGLVVHYLAGLRSGLVLTPLNYRYVPPEIDHALTVSGAAAPWLSPSTATPAPSGDQETVVPTDKVPAATPAAPWSEPSLIPDVVEEPELIELHQADPSLAEDVELAWQEQEPAPARDSQDKADEDLLRGLMLVSIG